MHTSPLKVNCFTRPSRFFWALLGLLVYFGFKVVLEVIKLIVIIIIITPADFFWSFQSEYTQSCHMFPVSCTSPHCGAQLWKQTLGKKKDKKQRQTFLSDRMICSDQLSAWRLCSLLTYIIIWEGPEFRILNLWAITVGAESLGSSGFDHCLANIPFEKSKARADSVSGAFQKWSGNVKDLFDPCNYSLARTAGHVLHNLFKVRRDSDHLLGTNAQAYT